MTTLAPASSRHLFVVFTRMALQGFGGVLPVAQHELVERERWLTREEFLQSLALSQVLPGPNVVNLALMVGQRYFGVRGAIAAMTGILGAPMVIVLALAILAAHAQGVPQVQSALRGMGVVASGLIVSTAIKLAMGLKRSPLSVPGAALMVALAFIGVGLLRWPLVAVVLGLGGAGWLWAAWRLGRPEAAEGANG